MPRRSTLKDYVVAESPAMRRLVAALAELADRDMPVLVRGEVGTGRELIARLLHVTGPRRERRLVVVQAQMAPELLAYDPHQCASQETLASAHGGTLLIRDLGEVPRPSQERLHALVQARLERRDDHDVRIVAVCDPDLHLAAAHGLFHPGLYQALGTYVVDVPPLRERSEDIVPLYSGFVRSYAAALGRGRMTVSSRAHDRLVTYPWPGNVAELKSVARRCVIRAEQGRIEPSDLDAILPVLAERAPLERMSFEDMVRSKLASFLRSMDGYPLRGLYEDVVARVERSLLSLVMEHTGGNQVRAAEILGLNRNTLRRKLGERGLLAQGRAVLRTKSNAKERHRAKGRAAVRALAGRTEPNG